jgi:hypothetical protein
MSTARQAPSPPGSPPRPRAAGQHTLRAPAPDVPTHEPTDPRMPWPGDSERLADEESVNPLMRWHTDAERLADEEKQAARRQTRIAHARWRVESPEGRVALLWMRRRGLRQRREDLTMRIGRTVLLLLAYIAILYLVTGGIASGAQRITLAVLISALAAIVVKGMGAIWRRSG